MLGVQFLDHFDSTLHFSQCERTLHAFALQIINIYDKSMRFWRPPQLWYSIHKEKPGYWWIPKEYHILFSSDFVFVLYKSGFIPQNLLLVLLNSSFFFWYAVVYITLLRDRPNWGLRVPEFRNGILANDLYHFASKWASGFAKVLPTPFGGVAKQSMPPPPPC